MDILESQPIRKFEMIFEFWNLQPIRKFENRLVAMLFIALRIENRLVAMLFIALW